jgi:hypothetical protein
MVTSLAYLREIVTGKFLSVVRIRWSTVGEKTTDGASPITLDDHRDTIMKCRRDDRGIADLGRTVAAAVDDAETTTQRVRGTTV